MVEVDLNRLIYTRKPFLFGNLWLDHDEHFFVDELKGRTLERAERLEQAGAIFMANKINEHCEASHELDDVSNRQLSNFVFIIESFMRADD